MHREKYWRSKLPVGLALLFLVNLLLIISLEILCIYRLPADLNEMHLVKWDHAYLGSTILSQEQQNSAKFYLVEKAGGDHSVLITQGHPIFPRKVRIRAEETVELPEAGDGIHNIKLGIRTAQYRITGQRINIAFLPQQSYRQTATVYMVLAAVLEGLELALWYLVKGRN